MELKQELIALTKRMSTVEQEVGIKPLEVEDPYIPGYLILKPREVYYTIGRKPYTSKYPDSSVPIIEVYKDTAGHSDLRDQLALLAGWVFKTQKEAEDKLECMLAYSEYIKAIQEENKRTGFVPDWTNRHQQKSRWTCTHWPKTIEIGTETLTIIYRGRSEEYMAPESLKIIRENLGKEKIIKALRN